MSSLAALMLILGLVLVDLVAVMFGPDDRPGVGQLPDRWFGGR